MLKLRIKLSERLALIGTTGSGKTVMAKWLLNQPALKRVVVIDPKHTFKHPRFETRNRLPASDTFWIIYRPQRAQEQDLIALIRECFKRGNITLYIDELQTLSDAYKEATEVLADVVRTGREKQVGVWFAMQRPFWVPKEFLTETEIFFIFNLRLGDDREYMSKFVGDEALVRLPKFGFWYDRSDEGKPQPMRLDLRTQTIKPLKEVANYG